MKQQSSMEFLLTYSWALVIISVFIAVVAILSLSRPVQTYVPSQCSITPLLPCLDSLLTSSPSALTLLFQNNLGQALYFPANAFNVLITNTGGTGTLYNLGSCAPSLLPVGGEAVCNSLISTTITLPAGAQFQTSFIITYELCSGSTSASCSTPTYATTGSSLQVVSSSGVTFNSLNFVVSGGAGTSSGMIVLNGVAYPSGDTAYFITGNYVIFAQPALGHSFSSWSVTAPSVVASTSAQNTILTLSTNAVLTATFS